MSPCLPLSIASLLSTAARQALGISLEHFVAFAIANDSLEGIMCLKKSAGMSRVFKLCIRHARVAQF